ncbi:hypothetical protein B0H16DRAFT_2496 [Mycena metata]|uniref:Uncharacterized protein n=1 Tax=Mycena metata TaxID=1033252 RepID=A0AAD7KHE2_9AGAR|nr:hypothetical protein B0H16DRAFT_2496 [Mycena metata]
MITPFSFSITMSTEPRLPLDLERVIFELAADGDLQSMVRLILVARKCRAWIEPLLYRSVVVCQSSWNFHSFLRTLEAHPARHAKWIKSIQIDPYILPNDPAVTRILSMCTGVVNLADFSHGRTPFSILSRLRLEKLCISLDIIEDLPDGPYFRHAAFAHLTHLHILDPPQRWPHIPFADLPSLTHLALQNYKTQIRSTNIPVLQKILSECAVLQTLVVFIPPCRKEYQNAENTKLLVGDRRLAILCRSPKYNRDIWAVSVEENLIEPARSSEDYIECGVRDRHSDSVWSNKTTRRRCSNKNPRWGLIASKPSISIQ